MNIIQRELRAATEDVRLSRMWLKRANSGIDTRINRQDAFIVMNRSRARLMNVVRATNIILGRSV